MQRFNVSAPRWLDAGQRWILTTGKSLEERGDGQHIALGIVRATTTPIIQPRTV